MPFLLIDNEVGLFPVAMEKVQYMLLGELYLNVPSLFVGNVCESFTLKNSCHLRVKRFLQLDTYGQQLNDEQMYVQCKVKIEAVYTEPV